ncbi:MAG: iron chelate uptake ABC transporter family permease subunit, partial [Clostridia bacterium]|nr:iron chelate uptake ABC transporter family permease subunit [Clostridia bacterium]
MQAHKQRDSLSLPVIILLFVLPLAAVFVSLFFGRYHLSFSEVVFSLIRPDTVSAASRVTVLQLRLPRAVAAAFVGASLAVSGAAFQSVFRNPLVNS